MKLSDFGEALGTRVHGREVKKILDQKFEESDDIIVLDFEGVRIVTNSFADELIGRKIREIGLDEFKRRTTFRNIDHLNELMVKRVIVNSYCEYEKNKK